MTGKEHLTTHDAALSMVDGVASHTTSSLKQQRRRALLAHSIRYTIVGTSSAAIELSLFFIFSEMLGVFVVGSNMVALTVATIYNFTMSRKWTFKSNARLTRSLVLYFTLFVWNQIFSSWTLVALMGLGLTSMLAKLVTMLCIVSWNFLLYRHVIFK